jgi:hypothetical protein
MMAVNARFAALLRVASVLLIAACGGGGRDVVDPPPVNGDFGLSVLVDQADAGIAQKLGWSSGIPGAEVTVSALSGGEARTFTTSASGTVTIPSLSPGKYKVVVRRLLTAGEIATLNEVSGAGGFTGDSEIEVTSTVRTATVAALASFRTSLVISEWAFHNLSIPGVGGYNLAGFMELYNNSDTTVYLDGILIAEGHAKSTHTPGTFSDCNLYAPYQSDPEGVWAEFAEAFPGTGRDYPLLPGKTVVIATDAIDHRTAFPDLPDLRTANFEFLGFSDVDNPAVPNMIDRGVRPSFFGHGILFNGALDAVAAVALPNVAGEYTRAQLPPQSTEHLRLPRAQLLDVFTSISNWMSLQQPPVATCSELVHSSMDRKLGVLMVENATKHQVSISRKVLRTLPDGRRVLQSTRSSANDFHRTPLNPGVILAP